MNIAVLIRQVPDTEAVVKPDTDRPGAIQEGDVKFVLNPYDEYAVEEALRIAEKTGGETVAVCVGPARAETAIRSALAIGLQRAVWVDDPAVTDADIITQAKAYAAAAKTVSPSLIFTGRELIDTQEDALAAAVAQFLDMPHVLCAAKVTVDGERAVVLREVESGSLEIETLLPAVLSASKGLNEPRYPNLMSIKRSKTKEVKKLTLAELGLSGAESKVKVKALNAPPPRPPGVRAEGEPQEVVTKAMEWLANTAKVV